MNTDIPASPVDDDPLADLIAGEQAQSRSSKRRAATASVAQKKRRKTEKRSRIPQVRKARPVISARHRAFLHEFLKNPTKQGDAYRAIYPNASARTAYRRAAELLASPAFASELTRVQNLREKSSNMTRARLENLMGTVVEFDFRRFFYSESDEHDSRAARDTYIAGAMAAGRSESDAKGDAPTIRHAGEPKAPHHLDEEAARVIESYEKSYTEWGPKIKFKGTPRLGAGELLGKLKGWLKDDARPAMTATFNFNFAPTTEELEVVPVDMLPAMGLHEGTARRVVDDPEGAPAMPHGYKGVKMSSPAAELSADLDALEDAEKP